MSHDNLDRVIALAGIYQAVNCVMRIARHGSADTDAMEPCIYSLLQVNARRRGCRLRRTGGSPTAHDRSSRSSPASRSATWS
jgi:hypothetical protein